PAAAQGTLNLNGNAQTPGTLITVTKAQLDANQLVFTPASNKFGTGLATISFQVRDDAVVPPGSNTDPTPNNITINVTSVNDAPVGTSGNAGGPVLEDTAYAITLNDFGFTDPSDTPPAGTGPANSIAAVTIVNLPAVGQLTLSGTPVTANQSIDQALI